MRKINWKLWAGRAVSIVIALISGGAFFADGSTAVMNASNEAGSVFDFLPVAGEGIVAFIGAALPFFLHRFFPQLADESGLPKEIQEAVTSLASLAINPKEPKLQRRALQDVLDVAFIIAGSFTNSKDVKAALLHVSQLVHDALGPGVAVPVPPVVEVAPVQPVTLVEAMR